MRTSIWASHLGSAERPFSVEVGSAQMDKPGYQTRKIRSRWEYLSWAGLPNTPLIARYFLNEPKLDQLDEQVIDALAVYHGPAQVASSPLFCLSSLQ
jgi:hypothetical protein